MVYEGFLGGTATVRSPNFNVEQTKNWYPEPSVSGRAKSNKALIATPGLDVFSVLGLGQVRGLWSENDQAFAVAGPGLWELTASQLAYYRGPVVDDGGRSATFASTGTMSNQLVVSAGGYLYVYDLVAQTLNQVLDPGLLFPSAMIAFCDGYILNLKQNSRQWQFSGLIDGTTYDPLDVNEVSQASDNLRAMIVHRRQIWFMGGKTSTVWADLGDPLIPFQPIPGAFFHMGIVGEFAWSIANDSLMWLGESNDGNTMVFVAQGYQGQQISQFAIPYRLAQIPTLSDVVCWGYQQEGHVFFVIYPPTSDTTFVFDTSTQEWHERNIWDTTLMRWLPHLGRCHTFAFGKHLVGDRQSPAVYSFNLDAFSDALVVTI